MAVPTNILETHSADWPAGFHFSAGHCGLKRAAPDLALIWSDTRFAAAAVFTTNRLQAAPVRLSRAHLRLSGGWLRALVVNSGNANCATGERGERAALETAQFAARLLSCPPEEIFVASTGVIGVPLDQERILAALPRWLNRNDGPAAAAQAILTTDTRPKTSTRVFTDNGREFRIAGMAKGSGMIHPRMATMLAFIFTDADWTPAELRLQLRPAVGASFHRLAVDGDTSTNDACLLAASGAAGRLSAEGRRRFRMELDAVARELAIAIARDGEGAKRLVKVVVEGGRTPAEADRAARAIALSPLVKTALAGADPNWGRILAAAGYSGARFQPARAEVWFNELRVYGDGRGLNFDEAAAKRELDQDEVIVRLDLHAGRARAWMWTCDLTEGYIKINASYRT